MFRDINDMLMKTAKSCMWHSTATCKKTLSFGTWDTRHMMRMQVCCAQNVYEKC